MSQTLLDETHDAATQSWEPSANSETAFPLQNLPLGIAAIRGGAPRGVVAIGERVFDIAAGLAAGLFDGEALEAAQAAAGPTLNPLMALPAEKRRGLRRRLFALLATNAPADLKARTEPVLAYQADCVMQLPAAIGDYTDFYAGIHHARTVGSFFRPDSPLLPNYKFVPIGYHGRASSIRPSGEPVRRPSGQLKAATAETPTVGPCARLDYELELGLWIGPGNALGKPIAIGEAGRHLVGVSLLNDWSARDMQTWEYQPLGPFLAKSFMTSVSPWIVTAEALAPFRTAQPARPDGDPSPLPYLMDEPDQAAGAFAITLEVSITTEAMRADGTPPHRLSRGSALDLYWTAAQLIAHHTSNGCDLRPGDLLGTGTISGPEPASSGSLLELSRNGTVPITLPSTETRRFLEDGDEVTFTATCERPGFVSIGLGACSGRIVAGG